MDIKEIIAHAGGYPKVAREMGTSRAAIHQWRKVPPKRVMAISKLSGLPPYVIRPDIFEKPETA